MNSIDKTIFNDYETVETTLLNELATEARTKGKKARSIKGEGYYVKYDGVQYDITPEQCRIHKLLKNNYNVFVKMLNSAKNDTLGFWKMAWGDRLPVIIANLEKGIEICQKYFDAFKTYITEPEKNETVETEMVENAVETVSDEKNDENKTEITKTVTEETEDEIVVEQGVGTPFIKADKSDGSSRTIKNGSQNARISR